MLSEKECSNTRTVTPDNMCQGAKTSEPAQSLPGVEGYEHHLTPTKRVDEAAEEVDPANGSCWKNSYVDTSLQNYATSGILGESVTVKISIARLDIFDYGWERIPWRLRRICSSSVGFDWSHRNVTTACLYALWPSSFMLVTYTGQCIYARYSIETAESWARRVKPADFGAQHRFPK